MKNNNQWQKPDINILTKSKKGKSSGISRQGNIYATGVPPMPTPASRILYGVGVPPTPAPSATMFDGLGVPPASTKS